MPVVSHLNALLPAMLVFKMRIVSADHLTSSYVLTTCTSLSEDFGKDVVNILKLILALGSFF